MDIPSIDIINNRKRKLNMISPPHIILYNRFALSKVGESYSLYDIYRDKVYKDKVYKFDDNKNGILIFNTESNSLLFLADKPRWPKYLNPDPLKWKFSFLNVDKPLTFEQELSIVDSSIYTIYRNAYMCSIAVIRSPYEYLFINLKQRNIIDIDKSLFHGSIYDINVKSTDELEVTFKSYIDRTHTNRRDILVDYKTYDISLEGARRSSVERRI